MNRPAAHAPPVYSASLASRSRVASSGDRQKQDLRDFTIGQDWGISTKERFQSCQPRNLENPDSDDPLPQTGYAWATRAFQSHREEQSDVV